jgi:hypothetical protein
VAATHETVTALWPYVAMALVSLPALRTERAQLACGVVAPPLFVVVFLVMGMIRADYDPLRHPVSSLSISMSGWTQITNFVITGSLLIVFAMQHPTFLPIGGLLQRLALISGLTWVAALALRLLRRTGGQGSILGPDARGSGFHQETG